MVVERKDGGDERKGEKQRRLRLDIDQDIVCHQTLPSYSTDRPPSVRPALRRPVPSRCLRRGGRVVAGAAKALQDWPAWTVSVQTTPMCPDFDALLLLCLRPPPPRYHEPPVLNTVPPGARSRRCLDVVFGRP